MTCHHTPEEHEAAHRYDEDVNTRLQDELHKKELAAKDKIIEAMKTPDAENYEIVEVQRIGPHLVMKVLYPNCKNCSYEGNKILVFLGVTEVEVLKWRRIDPHFRLPRSKVEADPKMVGREAPGPNARFPASDAGWKDAIAYATHKLNQKNQEGIR